MNERDSQTNRETNTTIILGTNDHYGEREPTTGDDHENIEQSSFNGVELQYAHAF